MPSQVLFNFKKIQVKKKLFLVCNNKVIEDIYSIDTDFGFLCMDLTFIYSILVHGYGLEDTKEIFVNFNFLFKIKKSFFLMIR